MKQIITTLLGFALLLLGLIFLIVPGPSLILIIPGLFLLSVNYEWPKPWLKKAMKLAQKSARWIDRQLNAKKYFS